MFLPISLDLQAITVDANNPVFASVDGVLYSKDRKILINYPCRRQGTEYHVPSTVTDLCCTSFAACRNLTDLYLEGINTWWYTYTFYSSGGLTVHYLPGGNTEYKVNQEISAGKVNTSDPRWCSFQQTNAPTVNPDPVPSDNVANFVLRCYTKGLGRDEASVRVNDAGGLRYWYDILKSKQLTCQQVGTYFAASDEAATKYPGNEEFVAMLYRLYMEDRSYDQGGFDYWVGLLNNSTLTRAQVNDYFGVSDEFRAIVASYGL